MKNSSHANKQGLLDFFGKGEHVPVPTKERTPIETVMKRRDNLEENSPDSEEGVNEPKGRDTKKEK